MYEMRAVSECQSCRNRGTDRRVYSIDRLDAMPIFVCTLIVQPLEAQYTCSTTTRDTRVQVMCNITKAPVTICEYIDRDISNALSIRIPTTGFAAANQSCTMRGATAFRDSRVLPQPSFVLRMYPFVFREFRYFCIGVMCDNKFVRFGCHTHEYNDFVSLGYAKQILVLLFCTRLYVYVVAIAKLPSQVRVHG